MEVKPSRLRLRGESIGENRLEPDSEGTEPISDFEAKILRDRSLIRSVVLDPATGEIIGYGLHAGTGMRRVVDREGRIAFQDEVGLESPALDPTDFVPSPGTLFKAGKAAVGVGGKIFAKAVAKVAGGKGATAAVTLPVQSILKMRQVSQALAKSRAKAGARATVSTESFVRGGVRFRLRGRASDFARLEAAEVGNQVYVFRSAQGKVVYVGITEKGGLTRMGQHLAREKPGEFIGDAAKIEIKGVGLSEKEALALEEDLIRQHKPRWNIDRRPYGRKFKGTEPSPEEISRANNTNIVITIELGTSP